MLKSILEFLDLRIYRLLSSKLIFVLGCQRSGTTLAYMLLTAHPRITGKNENESHFSFPKKGELLINCLLGRLTCFKLPTKTPKLSLITRKFPLAKILWITRNPLSVVSSMKSLSMNRKGENWLEVCGISELKRHAKLFPEINNIDFEKMDQVALGAYIYRYKMMTRVKYENSRLKTFVINYESLVENPKKTLSTILESIGLSWSERILQHEQVHKGKAYNIGDRPLDKTRIEPELCLNGKEIEIINHIAATEFAG